MADRIQAFSAIGRAAPAAVELHGPAAERHMHRHLGRLLEGRSLAGRRDLAVLRRYLVHVRGDHRVWLHQLVHNESGLAWAGHIRRASAGRVSNNPLSSARPVWRTISNKMILCQPAVRRGFNIALG